VIEVEIASNPIEKAQGLMFRSELGENQGMLFMYDEGANPSMWMKNMLIPLDILFIDKNLQIVHVAENVLPCKEEDTDLCPKYSAKVPVSLVLELPAHFVREHGVKIGNSVSTPSVLRE